ncbi:hypothetical protein B566_EDAN000970 [Ephemera danica]|nr:hypothetical protein B566_EDAN000970 [Ephemera danica]
MDPREEYKREDSTGRRVGVQAVTCQTRRVAVERRNASLAATRSQPESSSFSPHLSRLRCSLPPLSTSSAARAACLPCLPVRPQPPHSFSLYPATPPPPFTHLLLAAPSPQPSLVLSPPPSRRFPRALDSQAGSVVHCGSGDYTAQRCYASRSEGPPCENQVFATTPQRLCSFLQRQTSCTTSRNTHLILITIMFIIGVQLHAFLKVTSAGLTRGSWSVVLAVQGTANSGGICHATTRLVCKSEKERGNRELALQAERETLGPQGPFECQRCRADEDFKFTIRCMRSEGVVYSA